MGICSRIRSLLQSYAANANVELQQRANEYLALFRFDTVRYGVRRLRRGASWRR